MRVNVDSKVLTDPRFARAGARLRMHRHDVLGRCAVVWLAAYEMRVQVMGPRDVDAIAERKGFADALVQCGLAEATEDGIRIKGLGKWLGRLAELDGQREKANAVRSSVSEARNGQRNGHAARKGGTESHSATAERTSGMGPSPSPSPSPSPDQDHDQSQSPRARAIPGAVQSTDARGPGPQTGFVPDQEIVRYPSPSGPNRFREHDRASGSYVRLVEQQPDGTYTEVVE